MTSRWRATAFDFNPDAIAVSASRRCLRGQRLTQDHHPVLPHRHHHRSRSEGQALLGQTYVTRAGLVAAPDGTIVVADDGAFAIDRATGAGSRVKTFARGSVPGVHGVFRPSGVAVAADGEVYVDTDGRNGGTIGPAPLAIDPDGRTHVLDTGPPTRDPGRSGLPPAAALIPLTPPPSGCPPATPLTPNTSSSATSAPSHR